MKRKLIGATLGVGGVMAAMAWAFAPGQQAGMLPYQDTNIVAQGAKLYANNCASCHGDDLKGQANWRERDAEGYLPAPPHDETGHTWHHPDAQLIQITRAGTEAIVGGNYKSRMIGFGNALSEPEIRAVLAYIKSTWPQRIIDAHNRINSDAALGG